MNQELMLKAINKDIIDELQYLRNVRTISSKCVIKRKEVIEDFICTFDIKMKVERKVK